MTRRGVGFLGLALAGVVAAGFVAGRLDRQPHAEMAVAAASLMFVATVAAGLAEAAIARGGGESLVLAYWVGVGVRGLVGVVGVIMLARLSFETQDRRALVLWVLTSYLVVLVFETVRAVRVADLAWAAKREGSGVPND